MELAFVKLALQRTDKNGQYFLLFDDAVDDDNDDAAIVLALALHSRHGTEPSCVPAFLEAWIDFFKTSIKWRDVAQADPQERGV